MNHAQELERIRQQKATLIAQGLPTYTEKFGGELEASGGGLPESARQRLRELEEEEARIKGARLEQQGR